MTNLKDMKTRYHNMSSLKGNLSWCTGGNHITCETAEYENREQSRLRCCRCSNPPHLCKNREVNPVAGFLWYPLAGLWSVFG